MINNSTNINKTNKYFSPKIIEHKKDQDMHKYVDWNPGRGL